MFVKAQEPGESRPQSKIPNTPHYRVMLKLQSLESIDKIFFFISCYTLCLMLSLLDNINTNIILSFELLFTT